MYLIVIHGMSFGGETPPIPVEQPNLLLGRMMQHPTSSDMLEHRDWKPGPSCSKLR